MNKKELFLAMLEFMESNKLECAIQKYKVNFRLFMWNRLGEKVYDAIKSECYIVANFKRLSKKHKIIIAYMPKILRNLGYI